jgi:2-polyprenyl-3-methyl-5-hydroxy-6-metoxy-1,4-benzoquinol methylase
VEHKCLGRELVVDSVATMAPNAWDELAPVYELARSRLDWFDRILEWPAQRAVLGDVTGLRILDAGCGSGAKAVALAEGGAAEVVGIDIAQAFVAHDHVSVDLVQDALPSGSIASRSCWAR